MYNYYDYKQRLMTEKGQELLFAALRGIRKACETAGACRAFSGLVDVDYGDTFTAMAILDRLIELKEIREVTVGVAGQDRVFVIQERTA